MERFKREALPVSTPHWPYRFGVFGGLNLLPGAVYRRSTLHEVYGGDPQKGIVQVPSRGTKERGNRNFDALLLFAHEGSPYQDGWTGGKYLYEGMGLAGNMELKENNAWVLRQRADGRPLLVFEPTREGHLFVGQFRYESHTSGNGERT